MTGRFNAAAAQNKGLLDAEITHGRASGDTKEMTKNKAFCKVSETIPLQAKERRQIRKLEIM